MVPLPLLRWRIRELSSTISALQYNELSNSASVDFLKRYCAVYDPFQNGVMIDDVSDYYDGSNGCRYVSNYSYVTPTELVVRRGQFYALFALSIGQYCAWFENKRLAINNWYEVFFNFIHHTEYCISSLYKSSTVQYALARVRNHKLINN